MLHRIKSRWSTRGGYGQAIHIGLPLVISMLSSTVMIFTDRMFLANYSLKALAASVPAHVTAFLFLSFFMGVAEYVGVFVSQYTGSCRHDKVGRAIWQGLWFCVPSSLFLGSLWFLADPIFTWAGHPPDIRELEVVYFRILTLSNIPFLVGICLSCFFSGRGLTKPVMFISIFATLINIPLDYCLINGVGPFPELGIVGAGIATCIGLTVPVLFYAKLMFTKENEDQFKILSSWQLDRDLFSRFMRYGLPGGVQFFLDMIAISFFVFMVGRYGDVELAATNAVFSVYNIAFLPTIGMSIATSIMVGQAMGERDPELAEYSTKTVLQMTVTYMFFMVALFVGMPEMLMAMFEPRDSGSNFQQVAEMGVVLLRYAAAFTLLDAFVIVYMGALKGAGDTKFIMLTMGTASVVCMIIPVSVLNWLGVTSIHGPWLCLLGYVVVLTTTFRYRFRKGIWKSIDIIGVDRECAKQVEGASPLS